MELAVGEFVASGVLLCLDLGVVGVGDVLPGQWFIAVGVVGVLGVVLVFPGAGGGVPGFDVAFGLVVEVVDLFVEGVAFFDHVGVFWVAFGEASPEVMPAESHARGAMGWAACDAAFGLEVSESWAPVLLEGEASGDGNQVTGEDIVAWDASDDVFPGGYLVGAGVAAFASVIESAAVFFFVVVFVVVFVVAGHGVSFRAGDTATTQRCVKVNYEFRRCRRMVSTMMMVSGVGLLGSPLLVSIFSVVLQVSA